MRGSRFLGSLAALAVAWSMWAMPAHGADAVEYDLEIEQQPLGTALQEFSKQSGVQVVFLSKITDGLAAPEVKGRFTVDGALRRLLNRSELTFRELNSKTIEVQAKGQLRGAGASAMRVARSENPEPADNKNSDNSSESPSGDAEDKAAKLQEIVVTAQKREERLKDVPISITVLDGEKLDSSTYVDFNEALRTIPGFDSNEDEYTGGIRISIRGVSNSDARGGGPGPAAYYIDGVPFGFVRHSIVPGGGNLYDLERLEFLAGPQGTLYGANALNGVLRFITKDPNTEAFEFKARAGYSSVSGGGDGHQVDAAVNVPLIEGKLALRGVVGHEAVPGWIDDFTGHDINDAENRNYRLKVKATPSDTFSIVLSAWRSDTDNGAAPLGDDNDRVQSTIEQWSEQSFSVYSATMEKEFSGFSVSSVTSYLDYASRGVYSGESLDLPIRVPTFINSHVVAEEINFVSDLNSSWRWSAGLYYRDAKDTNYQLFDGFGGFEGFYSLQDDYTDESKSWAVYGEIGRRFFDDKLDVGVGLRYYEDKQATTLLSQYFDPPLLGSPFKSKSDAVTPRAVATWKMTPDTSLFASYSQGFRSGYGQVPEVQSEYPAFPPTEPDKLTNYEIGVKGAMPNGVFDYTASLFFIDWQDIQQSITVPAPPDYTGTTGVVINGESASGLGAEFTLTVRPLQGLQAGVRYSWNDLTFDEAVNTFSCPNGVCVPVTIFNKGDRLVLSPRYTVGGDLSYAWSMGDYNATIAYSVELKSPQTIAALNGETTTRRNVSQNASISLAAAQNWTVSAYVDNLANFTESPTPQILADGTVGQYSYRLRPRTVGLRFDYHY